MKKADMNKWYRRYRDLMKGRNGFDDLGRDVCLASFLLAIFSSLFKIGFLSYLSTAGYFYSLFRIFSRNIHVRTSENRIYRQKRTQFLRKLRLFSRRLKDMKDYRYFKCPECGQTLRVPRGKGEVEVTCPKCGHRFDRRT